MTNFPKLPIEAYMIYSPEREEAGCNYLSTGGSIHYLGWSRKGKMWNTLGHLTNHLAQHVGIRFYDNQEPKIIVSSCYSGNEEIIEISSGKTICTVKERFDYIIANRIKKDKNQQIKRLKYEQERNKKSLAHLANM
jgi:hypothetical protein